jgi:hypothetical protein
MKKESVDDLCHALSLWYPASALQPDVEIAGVLLDLKVARRKESPVLWRTRDVEQLLLHTLPADVLMTDESAAEVLAALGSLLTFLDQSGRLAKGSAAAADLIAEVTVLQLEKALADPSLWGPRKQLLAAASANGVDIDDADAMSDFIQSVVGGLNGPAAGGLQLPARRVAEPGALAQAVRQNPVFTAAVDLAAWVGEGRSLTREFLTKAEAVKAQTDLGITSEQLALTWKRAWDWGLLDIGTRKAHGAEAPEGDEEWLDCWHGAFDMLLNDPPGFDGNQIWINSVDGSLFLVLCMAHAVPEGLPHAEAVELFWDAMVEEELRGVKPPVGSVEPWRAGLTAYLDERLQGLRELGALTSETHVLALTPLGVAGVIALVQDHGGSAPSFTSVPDLRADEVLDLMLFCVDPVLEEWLSDRDPVEATRELLSAASTRGPAARSVAFGVASESGPAVHPVVEPWCTNPTMGPHARALLAGESVDPSDAAWLVVDTAAVSLDDPHELNEHFDGLPTGPYEALVSDLWRVEHPDTLAVLEVLGKHPDKARAKVARKATFKAQSRR